MLIFPRVKAWHEVPCLYTLVTKVPLVTKSQKWVWIQGVQEW